MTLTQIDALEKTKVISARVATRLRDQVASGALLRPMPMLFEAEKLARVDTPVRP